MITVFFALQNLLTRTLRRDDRGATAVEYGLMVALIALAVIVAVTALGGAVSGLFDDTEAGLTGVAPAAP